MSELFLASVRFKDFRTFGEFETEIVPGPGLTLLVGTNGLGKSSFFDALEWGLTGEVRRFKNYLRTDDDGRYLTRRGASQGTHEVDVRFSDGSVLMRGANEQPDATEVIALLKKTEWTAQIQDIGTYLAFTHFLGQAAQQRFTSREPGEQWDSLKGPSGIDRLEEVRNGLRGRGTQLAFNRRIRRETDAVAEIARQLKEWRGWRVRLARVREAADAAGALPPDAFAHRLDALEEAAARLRAGVRADPGKESVAGRLSAVRTMLDALRGEAVSRRTILEGLSDLPERYAAEAAAADAKAPPLVEARATAAREVQALADATAVTTAARTEFDAATADVASRDAELSTLESTRADLETAARAASEIAQLEPERHRLDEELTRYRAELQGLDGELDTIDQRAAALAGLASAATAAADLAELARQLPDLRSRAAASVAAQSAADTNAVGARERLLKATADQTRLRPEIEQAGAALEAARARASALAAAVASIARHLHDDDLECPVCGTGFPRGSLRLVAREAATARDAVLSAAESQHAALGAQLQTAEQAITAAEAVVRVAEQARIAAAADQAALADLERRLVAALPEASHDLLADSLAAEQLAAAALSAAQTTAAADEARRAAATTRRNDLRGGVPALEQQLSTIREQIAGHSAERRSALERLAAKGQQDARMADVDLRLAAIRTARAVAESARVAADQALRTALHVESGVRERWEAAEEALRRLTATQAAAAAGLTAVEDRWREAGVAGTPSTAALEAALSALSGTVHDIERCERERSVLVSAYEVTVRDQELRDLLAEMDRVSGSSAASDPERHETELQANLEAAQAALQLTKSSHVAVEAFADKLREEATKFSTQFLTPLNGLIDDFNEALLSMPGESIRLKAEYHKDRTQFDMGLHYRDAIDDALYDTGLPPQVVLSEGQLAANGFSILCAASTAYPWSRWRALLLDDPLQHNDIIHAAAFVDLMRNLVELQRYQLIMSSHDRGEAAFIKRKFDAAGLPCSIIALTAPWKAGVRYLPAEHNGAARDVLAGLVSQSA